MGDKNVLARTKQADKMQDRAMQSSGDAFKELDQLVDKPKASTPQSKVAPSELQLLDVDNVAYKSKRNEVLQQPESVVGHVTVQ
jgi:hypothetical protein